MNEMSLQARRFADEMWSTASDSAERTRAQMEQHPELSAAAFGLAAMLLVLVILVGRAVRRSVRRHQAAQLRDDLVDAVRMGEIDVNDFRVFAMIDFCDQVARRGRRPHSGRHASSRPVLDSALASSLISAVGPGSLLPPGGPFWPYAAPEPGEVEVSDVWVRAVSFQRLMMGKRRSRTDEAIEPVPTPGSGPAPRRLVSVPTGELAIPVAEQPIPELVLSELVLSELVLSEPVRQDEVLDVEAARSLELVPDSEWDPAETQPAPVVTLAGQYVPTEESAPTTPISLVPAPREAAAAVVDPWARPEAEAGELEDAGGESIASVTLGAEEAAVADVGSAVVELDDVVVENGDSVAEVAAEDDGASALDVPNVVAGEQVAARSAAVAGGRVRHSGVDRDGVEAGAAETGDVRPQETAVEPEIDAECEAVPEQALADALEATPIADSVTAAYQSGQSPSDLREAPPERAFDPLLDPLTDPVFQPGEAPSEELEPVFLAAAEAQKAAEQAAQDRQDQERVMAERIARRWAALKEVAQERAAQVADPGAARSIDLRPLEAPQRIDLTRIERRGNSGPAAPTPEVPVASAFGRDTHAGLVTSGDRAPAPGLVASTAAPRPHRSVTERVTGPIPIVPVVSGVPAAVPDRHVQPLHSLIQPPVPQVLATQPAFRGESAQAGLAKSMVSGPIDLPLSRRARRAGGRHGASGAAPGPEPKGQSGQGLGDARPTVRYHVGEARIAGEDGRSGPGGRQGWDHGSGEDGRSDQAGRSDEAGRSGEGGHLDEGVGQSGDGHPGEGLRSGEGSHSGGDGRSGGDDRSGWDHRSGGDDLPAEGSSHDEEGHPREGSLFSDDDRSGEDNRFDGASVGPEVSAVDAAQVFGESALAADMPAANGAHEALGAVQAEVAGGGPGAPDLLSEGERPDPREWLGRVGAREAADEVLGSFEVPGARGPLDTPDLPGTYELLDARGPLDAHGLPGAPEVADEHGSPDSGGLLGEHEGRGTRELQGARGPLGAYESPGAPEVPDAYRSPDSHEVPNTHGDSFEVLGAGEAPDSHESPSAHELPGSFEASEPYMSPSADEVPGADEMPSADQVLGLGEYDVLPEYEVPAVNEAPTDETSARDQLTPEASVPEPVWVQGSSEAPPTNPIPVLQTKPQPQPQPEPISPESRPRWMTPGDGGVSADEAQTERGPRVGFWGRRAPRRQRTGLTEVIGHGKPPGALMPITGQIPVQSADAGTAEAPSVEDERVR